MSERVINDPSVAGWEFDPNTGYWMWAAESNGGSGDGTGAGMIISETEPDAVDGTQWLNALTGEVFIYDDGKWLEFPQGRDGAAGADGNIADATEQGVVATWDSTANSGTGQWTPNDGVTIDGGNATFSGTLGVGTNNAQRHLTIYQTAFPTLQLIDSNTVNSYGPNAGLEIQQGGVDSYIVNREPGRMRFYTDNAERLTIDPTGNVGINVDAPQFPLHVKSLQNAAARIESATEYCLMNFDNSGTTVSPPSVGSQNDDFRIATGGNLRMVIDSSGQLQLNADANNENVLKMQRSGYWWEIKHVSSNILFESQTGGVRLKLNYDGDALFAGGVQSNEGPLLAKRELIKTLSTLRQATMDETQDIRESLRSAIDELVEGFEQEIAAMPAEDES